LNFLVKIAREEEEIKSNSFRKNSGLKSKEDLKKESEKIYPKVALLDAFHDLMRDFLDPQLKNNNLSSSEFYSLFNQRKILFLDILKFKLTKDK